MAKYSWPEKPSLLGTSVMRLDAPDKVTGRARYSYDINRPGMLYGRIARSPYPHARIVSVDLTQAEKAPGVKAVLAWKEPGAQVMYQGDPVAAVAADTEERAQDAMRLIRVRYEALPHLANVEQAMAADAPAVFGGNTRQGAAEETGDVPAGFAQATHTADATYATHVITHVCSRDARLRVRVGRRQADGVVSTQGVHQCRHRFAEGSRFRRRTSG